MFQQSVQTLFKMKYLAWFCEMNIGLSSVLIFFNDNLSEFVFFIVIQHVVNTSLSAEEDAVEFGAFRIQRLFEPMHYQSQQATAVRSAPRTTRP